MATTPTGLTVPAGTDAFDPDGDMRTLAGSLEGRIIVPVPNVTARDALSALVSPSASEPLYVHRQDATLGRQLERTTNGTTWTTVPGETGDALPLLTGYGAFEGPPAFRCLGSRVFATGGVVRTAGNANIGASVPFGVVSIPPAIAPPISKRLGVVTSFGGPVTARYDLASGELKLEYTTAATLTKDVWWASLEGLGWSR